MTDALIAVLILGLANGMLGQIVTFSSLFEPVRSRIDRLPGAWGEYLGELVSCPLCFGTWTAMLLSFLAVTRAGGWTGIDAVLAFFAGAGAINMIGILAGAWWRLLIELEDRE